MFYRDLNVKFKSINFIFAELYSNPVYFILIKVCE
jgi:hypothetical protein